MQLGRTKFKRYGIFVFPEFYPRGGFHDLAATTNDLRKAKVYAAAQKTGSNFVEVRDMLNGEELYSV